MASSSHSIQLLTISKGATFNFHSLVECDEVSGTWLPTFNCSRHCFVILHPCLCTHADTANSDRRTRFHSRDRQLRTLPSATDEEWCSLKRPYGTLAKKLMIQSIGVKLLCLERDIIIGWTCVSLHWHTLLIQ